MAENAEPPPSGPLVDIKTGYVTDTWLRWLEGNAYTTRVDIGSVISGVNEASAAASAAQATASAASSTAQAAQSNSFSVTADKALVSGRTSGGGIVLTDEVTITVSGGTPPYDFVWANESGDTFTPTVPTDTDNSTTATKFQINLSINAFASANYKCTATDAAAAISSITIGVSAFDFTTTDVIVP